MNPYSHRWSLPPLLSKSGLKPSVRARVRFVVLGAFFSLLLANSVIAAVTEGQIYPGVSIGHHSVSWKTKSGAYNAVARLPQSYQLTLAIGDKTINTTTTNLGASFDLNKTVTLAYNQHRSPIPLVGLLRSARSSNVGFVYKLDHERLNQIANDIVVRVGQPATNATIRVVNGEPEVVPDHAGLGVNVSSLTRIIAQSLADSQGETIHVKPEQVTPDIQANEVGPALAQAQSWLKRTITLTYNGKSFTATPTNIGYWLSFTPSTPNGQRAQLVAGIDQTQVKGWVQSVANQINIQPKDKKIVVSNGTQSVEQEGAPGLAINQDAATAAIMAAMNANRDLSYEVPTGPIPFKTVTTNAGGLSDSRYIELNLSTQHLFAWQDGAVVESSPMTSGATGAGFPTVTGTFHIYYKTTNTYLNGHPYGYNYNVFVQYWMPFYLGYGLHDASWRSSFGGQDYYWGGSHGCVNLPLATAAFLYSWADVGTTVWIHH